MIVADEILGHRLAALHEDVSEMKTALRQLTSAVNKLALVEQQQGQMAKSMERAFAAIEKVDARVAEIENACQKSLEHRSGLTARCGALLPQPVLSP